MKLALFKTVFSNYWSYNLNSYNEVSADSIPFFNVVMEIIITKKDTNASV
ncbi:hypothetical protein [uncultured Flavobacterium sp.]|nr:hypothetical protein [uncultured Flavobacterium sp.]